MFNDDKKLDENFWKNYKNEIFQKARQRGILREKESFFSRFLHAKITIPVPVAAVCGFAFIIALSTLFIFKDRSKNSVIIATHEPSNTFSEKNSKTNKGQETWATNEHSNAE